MTKAEVLKFNQNNLTTGRSKKGYGFSYFAKRDFKKDEKIMEGYGRFVNHQTSHCSVQVGAHKHYVPEKWTGRYWNHSCNPNCYMKSRSDGFTTLFALKNIKEGDEITYNYAMTELSWVTNAKETYVKCLCGEKKCKGKILSFSQLTPKEQSTLRELGICSQFILKGV